jgi:hypothetical protein
VHARIVESQSESRSPARTSMRAVPESFPVDSFNFQVTESTTSDTETGQLRRSGLLSRGAVGRGRAAVLRAPVCLSVRPEASQQSASGSESDPLFNLLTRRALASQPSGASLTFCQCHW